MGFFDRLKNIGKKKASSPKEKKEKPQIVLDMADLPKWADTLVKHFELHRRFDQFSEVSDALRKEALHSLKDFTDENILSAIPERSRTVNTVHGNEFAAQTTKLLKTARFTDLFDFENEYAEFHERDEEYKDHTKKNIAVLGEFMHKELKKTQEFLQQIEDDAIKFLGLIEEHKFYHIQQIQAAFERLEHLDVQREKYHELVESLQEDLGRTQKKREKIEEKIAEQEKLVRNDASLTALDELKKAEEKIENQVHEYQSAAESALKYYKRYAGDILLDTEVRKTLDGLNTDSAKTLSENTHDVIHALRQVAEQLEQEGRGNVQGLVKKLIDLANGADNASRHAEESLPKQQELKREILKDVAALQIYDQQQSLLRAQREEKKIMTKLDFLKEELSPNKRLVIEREMKDAALNLGAKITGALPDEEIAEGDNVLDEMEEKIEELEKHKAEPEEVPEELEESSDGGVEETKKDLEETKKEESEDEDSKEEVDPGEDPKETLEEDEPKEDSEEELADPLTEEEYKQQVSDAEEELKQAAEAGDKKVEKSEELLKKVKKKNESK